MQVWWGWERISGSCGSRPEWRWSWSLCH